MKKSTKKIIEAINNDLLCGLNNEELAEIINEYLWTTCKCTYCGLKNKECNDNCIQNIVNHFEQEYDNERRNKNENIL